MPNQPRLNSRSTQDMIQWAVDDAEEYKRLLYLGLLHPPEPDIEKQIEEDDDVIIDEEMTNRNVCIGMMKSDIVTLKSLDLIKDEQYEPVHLQSEGKRDSENYCEF